MLGLQLTDVVKNLLIINVILFIGTLFIGNEMFHWLGLYYPGSEHFRPYQLVTHMFMHAGFGHLFFNMFVLAMLGPPVEAYMGSKRFLFFYFLCGFGALALHILIRYFELQTLSTPEYSLLMQSRGSLMVGASGAIYGVLLGFGMFFPNSILQLIIPPIPIKAKYFVAILVVLELFLGFNPTPGSNIAHFAHLGGMLFGFLYIAFFLKPRV